VPRIFDPLTNPGTSRALFQLILGVKNPKEIADRLGVLSPTVIQQLHRLRRIGIVRLGEKRGRDQHYDIVWDRLLEIFMSKVIKFTQLDLKEQKIDDVFRRQFLEKERFREFLQSYLYNRLSLTPFSVIVYNNVTISDLMEDFQATIGAMLSNEALKKKIQASVVDEKSKEFLENLLLWYDLVRHVAPISQQAFLSSLKQSGVHFDDSQVRLNT